MSRVYLPDADITAHFLALLLLMQIMSKAGVKVRQHLQPLTTMKTK